MTTTRRKVLRWSGLGLGALASGLAASLVASACGMQRGEMTERSTRTTQPQKQDDLVLYVGTYTNTGSKAGAKQSEGIYIYRFDLSTGALKFDSALHAGDTPSYLTLDPSRRTLY